MPFSMLSGREKDIFFEYVSGYLSLRDKVKKNEIFTILFGYDYTNKISDNLSTKDKRVSPDLVRNYATRLRKKGLLNGRSIDDKYIYLFDNLEDHITFKLESKEDNNNSDN